MDGATANAHEDKTALACLMIPHKQKNRDVFYGLSRLAFFRIKMTIFKKRGESYGCLNEEKRTKTVDFLCFETRPHRRAGMVW